MVTLINRRSPPATAAATTTTTSATAENDQLSRLPDELVVLIVTKLDIQSLFRFTVAARRFLPLLAQIPSLTTALPPSLIVGKPKSPENTSPVPLKFFFGSIALLLCLPLLYFATRLFVRHHPYSWLAVITAVRAVRRFLTLLFVIAVVLLFRLGNFVLFHPVIRVPMLLFLSLLIVLITLPIRFLYRLTVSLFLPRVSDSGHEFFMRLTRLNSLDVTFPPLWRDHPRLWIRGETNLIGTKPYVIVVAGDIVDEFAGLAEYYGRWGFKVWFYRFHAGVFLRVFQLIRLVNLFPIAMEHSTVFRNVFSKSEGLNTKARFYFEEGIGRSYEDRLDEAKVRILKYVHLRSCTLSLNRGTLQLQDPIIAFFFFPDAQGHVVDKEFIWACLHDKEVGDKGEGVDDKVEGDKGEGCGDESDYERKELREAVRVILSTPGMMIGDIACW